MSAAENPAPSETVHVLTAGELRVEIATDTRRLEQVYGPRFDRSAVVISAKLNGTEFVEARGLCDEFGLRGMGVLGYDAAAVGDGEFLKIGVGVLRRDDPGDYTFVRHWPVAESLPVEVSVSESELMVTQRSPVRHGYAYRLTKRYSVNDAGELRIAYELENRGTRPFAFEHYNHNFFAFAGEVSDARYVVQPAFALPPLDSEAWLHRDGRVQLAAPAPARGGVVFGVELEVPASENRVMLGHARGASVELTGDFPVSRFAVWATRQAFCPEIFFRSEIALAATVRWERRYRFSATEQHVR